jgi:nitroreductase
MTMAAGAGLATVLTACGGAGESRYLQAARALRAPLRLDGGLAECARYATLAANGHNTQPWRFSLSDRAATILPDPTRRTQVVDPDDHHLWASLGCASENFLLAARALGLHGDARFDPADDGRVALAFADGVPETGDMFHAIPARQCTRSDYDRRPVPAADIASLEEAARIDGVRVLFLLDQARVETVLEQVIAGNTAQMGDAAFIRELTAWLRFNESQALETNDGLFSAASGNPNLPGWLARLLFPFVFTTRGENDKYAGQIRSSAGVAVFVSERDDREHWVKAGRSFQRFALKATALGIAHAFVNQPVEVAALREEFATWLGLSEGERPDFIVRFGYAPPLPMSLRRPVEEVMV